jgi:hypothetical protein
MHEKNVPPRNSKLQMLFNGLRNFEGNALVDEMQRMGMAIGPHINAYVSNRIIICFCEIQFILLSLILWAKSTLYITDNFR